VHELMNEKRQLAQSAQPGFGLPLIAIPGIKLEPGRL
jgi:hypothetical protein